MLITMGDDANINIYGIEDRPNAYPDRAAIIKIRRCHGRLIFITRIPIPGKMVLLLKRHPCSPPDTIGL